MRQFTRFALFMVIALGLVAGCKKKNKSVSVPQEVKKVAEAAAKELGNKPLATVAFNLQSLIKSPLFGVLKPKMEKAISEKLPCANSFLDQGKDLILVLDELKPDSEDPKGFYMVLKGIPSKKFFACVQKAKDAKFTKAKLGGQDAYMVEEDGEKTYFFAGSDKAIVAVAGSYVKKVVPGKGVMGKGLLPGSGSDTLAFEVGAVKILSGVRGIIDASKGLNIKVSVGFKEKDMAEMVEMGYEAQKDKKGAFPPGTEKFIKKLSVHRSGATITAKIDLSESDIKELVPMIMSQVMKRGM